MFIGLYTADLYIYMFFMTCSTSCCIYDTLMDPWNIRMYIHMYVCTCVCTYVCMYIPTYMCVCVCVCVYVYVRVYVCICMYVYTFIHVCVFVHMHMCVCVCVCAHAWVCMCVCMHVFKFLNAVRWTVEMCSFTCHVRVNGNCLEVSAVQALHLMHQTQDEQISSD